jgi:alpha-L-fucosidase
MRNLLLTSATLLILALSTLSPAADPPKPFGAIPTKAHLEWQRGELSLFAHFGVNTFTNREWGDGKEDEKIFNPAKLDTRQWAAAAKAGGFKLAILTAKHHDGFCLWPSAYTDHSVKSSPWKDGKGDVVGEFVESFRAEGIRVGLYLSPWDRHEKVYGDSPKYNEYYRNQLTELMTRYGKVAEVWFDGANGEGPNGKRQVYDFPSFYETVFKHQPDAMIFSDAGPGVRWIGNERGTAGDPNWSTVDPAVWLEPGKAANGARTPNRQLQNGTEGGTVWRPGECDVSIRPGWFYHPGEDRQVKNVNALVNLYFMSVGRNSLLLLNVPPNTDGLLADRDVQTLAAFRAKLDEIFMTDLARSARAIASNTRGSDATFAPAKAVDGDIDSYWATDDGITTGWIELNLDKPTKFNIACMQEAIWLGQRVAEYHLEAWDGNAWQSIAKGTTIGHKKLDRLPAPVTAQRVRLVIDRALACPTINNFGLYLAE